MHSYVERMSGQAPRAGALLDRIIARPRDHARLLNTLSRLEYVGVRKMLKSRRAERLDLDGLEHLLDETIHALRLKKAALALADDRLAIATYGAGHTLAGEAGEAYMQGVDRAAEARSRLAQSAAHAARLAALDGEQARAEEAHRSTLEALRGHEVLVLRSVPIA